MKNKQLAKQQGEQIFNCELHSDPRAFYLSSFIPLYLAREKGGRWKRKKL